MPFFGLLLITSGIGIFHSATDSPFLFLEICWPELNAEYTLSPGGHFVGRLVMTFLRDSPPCLRFRARSGVDDDASREEKL